MRRYFSPLSHNRQEEKPLACSFPGVCLYVCINRVWAVVCIEGKVKMEVCMWGKNIDEWRGMKLTRERMSWKKSWAGRRKTFSSSLLNSLRPSSSSQGERGIIFPGKPSTVSLLPGYFCVCFLFSRNCFILLPWLFPPLLLSPFPFQWLCLSTDGCHSPDEERKEKASFSPRCVHLSHHHLRTSVFQMFDVNDGAKQALPSPCHKNVLSFYLSCRLFSPHTT